MKIEKISKDEISLIEALWCELKQHHQDKTTYFTDYYQANNFAKRKAELLNKDRLAIFVASNDDQATGFCVASIAAQLGEIDSLYVQPSLRGIGMGQQLMAAGLDWLNQQEPDSIRLSVGEGNEEAIAYYEKLGFKKRATVMQFFGGRSKNES